MRVRQWLGFLAVGVSVSPASADVELGAALRALRVREPNAGVPRAWINRRKEQVSLVIEHPRGSGPAPRGAVRIADDWFALTATEERMRELCFSSASRFYWAPGKRLLLDRADGFVHASNMRQASGAGGRGVLIGVVDTGVDVLHPDLRNADGTTRIRWLLDFNRPPLGRHRELERDLGCLEASAQCAVYSGADLDELVNNARLGDEPSDTLGHGTHVASLAASNGRSGNFVGVAPEADLLVVSVSGASASQILDTEILLSARFLFERAAYLGMPAVLNLSLGSDFGAHDGSSALERALSSLVGPSKPGRAIVVAAGNSGGLYVDEAYAGARLGVHTGVHLPGYSPARVPLITAASTQQDPIRAAVYVWIAYRTGDEIAVGFARDGEELAKPVGARDAVSYQDEDLEVTILNGVEGPEPGASEVSAVLVLSGSWPRSTRFEIRLEGRGSAALWVQSDGDLDPMRNSGALFPFASQEGTINVPASAPDLIAVGATVNRLSWIDYQGNTVESLQLESDPARAGDVAYFSSFGPNSLGTLKPEILAPGASVIGAMSSRADPRRFGRGVFLAGGRCEEDRECYVVDDTHAVLSGTSMAAPLVSGAIALLFERDPSLTQDQARGILLAGARPIDAKSNQPQGGGLLDLDGAWEAQLARTDTAVRLPASASTLTLSASWIEPDPSRPIEGYLRLRDQAGQIADGFKADRLRLTVSSGRIHEPLRREAPGLYRFAVSADQKSGGLRLRVEALFDDRKLAAREIPIAVDRGAATLAIVPRGGCSAAPTRTGSRGVGLARGAMIAVTALGVARRRRAHRRAR